MHQNPCKKKKHLGQDFLKRNIRKAVLIGGDKSLGPHRFVLALFQKACGKACGIVKDDLMTMFRTFMILE